MCSSGPRSRRDATLERHLDSDEVAEMAASVRGVSTASGESTLDALMTRDSGASLRGCLTAARYNATHVAPVEVIQNIGAAIRCLDDSDGPPSTAEEVASLMGVILAQLDELNQSHRRVVVPLRGAVGRRGLQPVHAAVAVAISLSGTGLPPDVDTRLDYN